MGVYNHLHPRNIAVAASLVSPDDPILFYWTCFNWNNICLVGLSALCHWLYSWLAVAEMASQIVRFFLLSPTTSHLFKLGDFPLKQGKSPGGGNNSKKNPRNTAKYSEML
jgi:hypothetical protein